MPWECIQFKHNPFRDDCFEDKKDHNNVEMPYENSQLKSVHRLDVVMRIDVFPECRSERSCKNDYAGSNYELNIFNPQHPFCEIPRSRALIKKPYRVTHHRKR